MPPTDVEKTRILQFHRDALVVDMHSDVHLDVIRSRGRGETRVLERRHLPRWQAGGVDVVVLNTLPKFGPDPYPYHTSPARNQLLTMDAILQEISDSPHCFTLILEPDNMLQARRQGRVGLILGMEGAEGVEYDLGLLRCYYRLGLRVMNLSWHHRNLAADGVAEPSDAGLSNFGRALVRELNRLGILIDLSHLSPRGVDDVLALSQSPVMASHSNAKTLCNHNRNLDDGQIESIRSSGGMIGVVFLGRFVAKQRPTLDHVLNHLDHIAAVAGTEHVGIGPDYCDYAEDMIIAARRVAGPGQPVDDPTIPFAEGLEDASTLPRLTEGLFARGYGDAAIRGILGENFLQLFREVREAARE